jgi:hypothetical protein
MKNKFILVCIVTLIMMACTKIDLVMPEVIDLGVKSTSTSIKSIKQSANIITAEFGTTAGSKYSIQIVPFGSDQPVKKEGFTASSDVTTKVLDLSNLDKKDYDLIFIDIDGKEVKYPIIIK